MLPRCVTCGHEWSESDRQSSCDAPDPRPLEPELRALRSLGPRILCTCGRDEARSLCPRLTGGFAVVAVWPGGHHLDRGYGRVARRVLAGKGGRSP